LDFDLARGAEAMRVTEPGQAAQSLKYDGPDGYGQEVRYVLDCARYGKRPEIVTAKDGLRALEICEAEEKSIQTGNVVRL
jgi:predicted dehydrogenase